MLSQNLCQQLQSLRSAHRPTLNQADHDPHVLHQRLGPRGLDRHRSRGGWRGCLRFRLGLLGRSGAAIRSRAALVQVAFSALPVVGLVVSDTAPGRLLPAVSLAATKGTAQILPPDLALILAPGIARIGEKEDAAVPTAGQAPSPMRLPSQYRSQDLVVLQDQPPDFRPAIPVWSKLKMLRDRYCKKAKLSLRMLTLL